MELKIGQPVEVVWRDAFSSGAELDPRDIDQFEPGYVNVDIGYYLGIAKNFVILGIERNEENDPEYRGITAIPLGDVVRIYTLGESTLAFDFEGGKNGVSTGRQRRKRTAHHRRGKGHANGKG